MRNICHLADCMQFMRDLPDNHYDLAICDPPYGIGAGDLNVTNIPKMQRNGTLSPIKSATYKTGAWDSIQPSSEYFSEVERISMNRIIWGVNHFNVAFDSGRIIWDKVVDPSVTFSQCEIAFTSCHKTVKKVTFMWSGMFQGLSVGRADIQQNKRLNEKRIHPTQKPVKLYKWLLSNYAKPGDRIFDSHVGSGSIRIACHDLDFEFEGCEIDADYHAAQEARFIKHTDQLRLEL